MTQPVVDILMTLILVAVTLWLINNYILMGSGVKRTVNALVIVAAGIWLLQTTGLWPSTNQRVSL